MSTTPPDPISITVRFGFPQLPDHTLKTDISALVSTIKWKIRLAVPVEYSTYSVRLIAGGRLLQDDWDMKRVLAGILGADQNRVLFLHCSLSEDEPSNNGPDGNTSNPLNGNAPLPAPGAPDDLPLQPAAIGFDALLDAGDFTAEEIAAIRAQFRSQINARYTPDQMPSGPALLRMEENWLRGSAFSSSSRLNDTIDGTTNAETSSAAGSTLNPHLPFNPTRTRTLASGLTPGGTNGAGDDGVVVVESEEDDAARALDDTLLGVLTGFFWPVGAVVWGLREEGVWSRRRGWSVLAGVVVNLGFGVVRAMG